MLSEEERFPGFTEGILFIEAFTEIKIKSTIKRRVTRRRPGNPFRTYDDDWRQCVWYAAGKAGERWKKKVC